MRCPLQQLVSLHRVLSTMLCLWGQTQTAVWYDTDSRVMLRRAWRYFDSRLSAVRYLIAACAFYGGRLLALMVFASLVFTYAVNIWF